MKPLKKIRENFQVTKKDLFNIGVSACVTLIASCVGYVKGVQIEEKTEAQILAVQEQCALDKQQLLNQVNDCFNELEFVLVMRTNFKDYYKQRELDSLLNNIEWKRTQINTRLSDTKKDFIQPLSEQDTLFLQLHPILLLRGNLN